MSSAPIRFLILLLGGWVGLRLIVHGVGFIGAEAMPLPEPVLAVASVPAPIARAPLDLASAPQSRGVGPNRIFGTARSAPLEHAHRQVRERRAAPGMLSSQAPPGASPVRRAATAQPPLAHAPASATNMGATPIVEPHIAHRWSASVWLLMRGDGDSLALAPGGTLGGSQAGARLLYRLDQSTARPLSLSARLYAPLRRTAGAEAALGLDWRPLAAVPIHLLAERRQRLGRDGRSAFSIAAYGGGSRPLGRGVRLDIYGQAGIVGLRARDAFADGAVRVAAPIGPVEAGGAVWAAAQPGAARVDTGPQLSIPLRTGRATLRLSAEWRFRIAGEARPDSGPALAIGTDF